MSAQRPIRGHVVKAADFDAVVGAPAKLHSDAEQVIRKAEDAAHTVRRIAEQESDRLRDIIGTISDEELKKFLDVETVRKKAAVFTEMLDQMAAMQKEFNELKPWLVALVEQSVRRIIGTLDDLDVITRIVVRAANEIDPGRCNTVRAGSRAAFGLREMQRLYPERFRGVSAIHTDSTLDADAIFMECSLGITDISLDTQITTLLEYMLSQEQPLAANQ